MAASRFVIRRMQPLSLSLTLVAIVVNVFLFFADANHIKILKFKESFEVNGDLADRVLFDTVRDSMDHIGSFSDAENASIYRSLNKDKNLFSETRRYSSFHPG